MKILIIFFGKIIIIASRSLIDIPSILIAAAALAVLIVIKKIQEPYIILIAAAIGLLLKTVL